MLIFIAVLAVSATAAAGRFSLSHMRMHDCKCPKSANGSAIVVGKDLFSPRGFTWFNNCLYVAEAGTATKTPGTVSTNGRISRFCNSSGIRETVVDGLPSLTDPEDNSTLGVADLAVIGNQLYVIISAGPAHGSPNFTSGVYLVMGNNVVLVADLDAFMMAHPPAICPACNTTSDEISNPYSMVAYHNKLFITDGNKDVVNVVDPSLTNGSNIARLADLSLFIPIPPLPGEGPDTRLVTTGIALGPDKFLYVSTLSAVPFWMGHARVFRVNPGTGQATLAFTNLTSTTGITIAPHGRAFVNDIWTSLSPWPQVIPPLFVPLGHLVEIDLRDGMTQCSRTDLLFPTILRWGPCGLYTTNMSVYSDDGSGSILLLPNTMLGKVCNPF